MQQTDSFEASPNTVDDSETPRPTTGWMYKNLVNNGIKYQPQLDRRISEPSTVVILAFYNSWLPGLYQSQVSS